MVVPVHRVVILLCVALIAIGIIVFAVNYSTEEEPEWRVPEPTESVRVLKTVIQPAPGQGQ